MRSRIMRVMRSRIAVVVALAALFATVSAGVVLAATIPGTAGVDTIQPGFTGQNDQIFALEGNDFVDGFDGNDEVYGNENNDTLRGAEDSDKVYGNTGNDSIDLQSFDSAGSVDQGFGGAGNDTINAKDGNVDNIDCGGGTQDTAFFDVGVDTIKANCELKNPATAAAATPEKPAGAKR